MWEKTPLGQSSCEVQPEQEETLQGSKLQEEKDNRPGGTQTNPSRQKAHWCELGLG